MSESSEVTLRTDVAAGFRLLHRHGLSDLAAGSLCARLPGEDWFFTHHHGLHFDEICASDLIKVNLEGEIIDGSNRRTNFAAVKPAARVFKVRPDVNAIIHAHGPSVMAVSAQECGLLPLSEPAFMFTGQLAYLEGDFRFSDAYCERIVEAFGADKRVLMLRNHAFTAAGRSVPEAFLLSYMLSQACDLQLRVQATGEKLHIPDEAAIEDHYDAFYGIEDYVYDGSLEWPGLLRSVEREDPAFRN